MNKPKESAKRLLTAIWLRMMGKMVLADDADWNREICEIPYSLNIIAAGGNTEQFIVTALRVSPESTNIRLQVM